jgi:hypothetical protein
LNLAEARLNRIREADLYRAVLAGLDQINGHQATGSADAETGRVCRSSTSIVMCLVSLEPAAIRAKAGQCLAGMPSFAQFAIALRCAASAGCRESTVGPPNAFTICSAERGAS